jgi:hypothetical protein
MVIDQTSTVMRNDTSMMAPLDEGLVVVSLASNAYIALDDIGRRVWELLETPMSVEALVAQLAQEFEGTPELIMADVLAFLAEMESAGLLHVIPAGTE